jgi:hypothetical protein
MTRIFYIFYADRKKPKEYQWAGTINWTFEKVGTESLKKSSLWKFVPGIGRPRTAATTMTQSGNSRTLILRSFVRGRVTRPGEFSWRLFALIWKFFENCKSRQHCFGYSFPLFRLTGLGYLFRSPSLDGISVGETQATRVNIEPRPKQAFAFFKDFLHKQAFAFFKDFSHIHFFLDFL